MESTKDMQDTEEVIRPDKRLTLTALVLLALVLAGAWLARDYLIPLGIDRLRQVNVAAPAGADARTSIVLLAMLAVPALLCLLYTFWTGLMAYRIFKTRMFPPKGYPILATTRVRRGGAARVEAVKFILSGVIALALLAYLCWSLFSSFPVVQSLRTLVA